MIYVYCGRNSEAADELATALGNRGARLRNLSDRGRGTSLIVNWGTAQRVWPRGIRVLNPHVLGDKLRELQLLQAFQVPIPPLSLVYRVGWLGRRLMHEDGNDFGAESRRADYWTQRLDIVDEYRVHSFHGRSLGVLKKMPRRGIEPHAFIRSYRYGWTFGYRFDRALIPANLREVAHRAVAAVGYDFGAVDIGTVRGGGLVVFEVNSAPGIEGDEVKAYAEALKDFA